MSIEHTYIPNMEGCSDGGCLFNYKPRGSMVTNGGCRCQVELQRSEEGRKAVRLILFLRARARAPEPCYGDMEPVVRHFRD